MCKSFDKLDPGRCVLIFKHTWVIEFMSTSCGFVLVVNAAEHISRPISICSGNGLVYVYVNSSEVCLCVIHIVVKKTICSACWICILNVRKWERTERWQAMSLFSELFYACNIFHKMIRTVRLICETVIRLATHLYQIAEFLFNLAVQMTTEAILKSHIC